jgi:2-amino-4-hydroxy-6-hydroxymethyldihydropteridine diphosphokinase
MTFDQTYLIALGANLPSGVGPPEETLRAALERFKDEGVSILQVSRFFGTPCFPPGAGPDYVNAAAEIGCAEGPRAMLDILHRVEAHFGRERVQRWGQRTLDLDLLVGGQTVLPDPETHAAWRSLPAEAQQREAPQDLILPHPRMHERAFVLVPLADIAPDWVHPLLDRSVRQMLSDLPPTAVAEARPL